MGMREEESAPSPKMRRAKLGILKAMTHISMRRARPRKWAKVMSRIMPSTLLRRVRLAICRNPLAMTSCFLRGMQRRLSYSVLATVKARQRPMLLSRPTDIRLTIKLDPP